MLEDDVIRNINFIALDGEGLSREDGTHDYVLLAASDGSFIEDYSSGGLSTEECFEFLLDIAEKYKGYILTGFYTSYDVNMIFRDLPPDVLAALWTGSTYTWRATSAGFKQYRLEYVPNRMLRIKQGCWSLNEITGRPKWTTFRSVIWWDSFQFFQMSFVKALGDWKVGSENTIKQISDMKDARGTFEAAEIDNIREYCFSECRLLVDMMLKVSDTLDLLNIKLTSWYGAGSIASALFKSYKLKEHIVQDWSEIDDELNTVVMSAYYGGRVETFAVGILDGASVNYDVRSAYPAATIELPSLTECEVLELTEYDYDEKYAIWKVNWKANELPLKFTPFPFRHMKRIYWPHTGSGWYHAEEVRAAIDVFNANGRISVTVERGYAFRPSNQEKPFSWVGELYEERAIYKAAGDPREKIIKLALNSLYGKTAQSIGGMDGKPPPYQCYLWAGMITADCRAKLMRAAALSGDNLLAIATDGLFTKQEIAELDCKAGLGNWDFTNVEAGLMLIQPGVYATPNLGKINGSFAKSRGFSSKKLRYDDFVVEWDNKKMAGAIKIAETRFIGFGYALAVNRLDDLWRRWIDGEKTIHFSGTISKSFDPRVSIKNRLIPLVSPNAPSDISAPYVPRTRNKDDSREYELQAEILASQPELEDNVLTWH